MTPATIVKEPSQSTALSPLRIGVLGVWISRKNSIMIKARPSKGKLIQKHHLLRSVCRMSFLSLELTSN